MKILFLTLFIFSCSTNKDLQLDLPSFNPIEKENLNRYLSTSSPKYVLEFGKIKIAKNLTLEIKEIYLYAYENLQGKAKIPFWLKQAKIKGFVFKEIFELTETHLKNIAELMKLSKNDIEIPHINCCNSDQKRQLSKIDSKLTEYTKAINPNTYSNPREYFQANLYWIFKKSE